MSTFMGMSWDYILQVLAPIWMELVFVISFTLGFIVMRAGFHRRSKSTNIKKFETLQSQLHKTVEAEVSAGYPIAAVKAWRRSTKARMPTQLETLKLIVQAFLEVDAASLEKEIIGHIAENREELCNSRTAVTVLDVVARAGQVTMMTKLYKVFCNRFYIQPAAQTYEVLLGGYASAGDEKAVAGTCAELRARRMKVSARGYSLTIKGFLKNCMLQEALKQILEMRHAGFNVPSFAVTQLIRVSCEAGRGMEMLQNAHRQIPIPPEAISILLEDCLKHGDLPQARLVEQIARCQPGSAPLPLAAYDALLKICVLRSDLHALELFAEMQEANFRISEGLCVGLLARCAETKFLRFAEEIAQFVRSRDGMTIAVYSALMKVYAYAGMYDKACGLYDEIVSKGMEPDAMMYGCLMKFAVECGRTDLSRELFDKTPTLDIQNYMSLIRAAGRDKDICRAFSVLDKLQENSMTLDTVVYNCVLDVCVSLGDLSRAHELKAEMQKINKLDIVSYNTLLKGYCAQGDIYGAKELLLEMENTGLHPNDVSFNSLINLAVSRNMWQEAWNTVDMMERSGVQADPFTVSIMMKALKRTKDSKHVGRALAMLDRSGLDVCSDEILLNTVLETCIRHREHSRLQNIINVVAQSSLQPCVHTYGSLIKAHGAVKNVDRCWALWHKMVDDRRLEPNDIVLGCMLDALVCNERTEEAVVLCKEWQPRIPANSIMYSTLIKGFANSRQASRAMDMWHEMQQQKLPMNTVVYNALIDAQARVGLMDKMGVLLQDMESHGCSPDSITYSTIVKGYCFKGDLDKAFEVFRSMQQSQMANDSVIYNTLLDGCVRHNRMDLVDTILEDMNRFSISPSNFTLGILVKMYGRRRQLDKAFKIVEEIPKKYGFKANGQVKTCLINACLNNNDLDRAMKVFDELRCSAQGADRKNYTSMISSLLRHGRLEQAVGLVEDAYGLGARARASALPPGQSLETDSLEQLLRALSQRGQMERLGMPLMNRLRAARIPVSGKLLSTFTQPMN